MRSIDQTYSRKRRTGIVSVPVLRAFFIQAVTLVFLFFSLHVLWRSTGMQLTLLQAALAQGALAAALSYRRLPSWWLPIQAVLPFGLAVTAALQLPAWLFLFAFLILVGLYWTTFQTRVPYFPSGRAAWEKMQELLPRRVIHAIDIGSGFGGLMLDTAKKRPDSLFTGVELAPLPWLVSVIRARLVKMRGQPAPVFLRRDYRSLNLADYDLVFAYLSPAAMPALWKQAQTQMRAGTMLLSYEFEVPGVAADFCVDVEGGRRLFGWRL